MSGFGEELGIEEERVDEIIEEVLKLYAKHDANIEKVLEEIRGRYTIEEILYAGIVVGKADGALTCVKNPVEFMEACAAVLAIIREFLEE